MAEAKRRFDAFMAGEPGLPGLPGGGAGWFEDGERVLFEGTLEGLTKCSRIK